MAQWCVNTNAQSNGDHEVHDLASTKNCLPAYGNRYPLGEFATCHGAGSGSEEDLLHGPTDVGTVREECHTT